MIQPIVTLLSKTIPVRPSDGCKAHTRSLPCFCPKLQRVTIDSVRDDICIMWIFVTDILVVLGSCVRMEGDDPPSPWARRKSKKTASDVGRRPGRQCRTSQEKAMSRSVPTLWLEYGWNRLSKHRNNGYGEGRPFSVDSITGEG